MGLGWLWEAGIMLIIQDLLAWWWALLGLEQNYNLLIPNNFLGSALAFINAKGLIGFV